MSAFCVALLPIGSMHGTDLRIRTVLNSRKSITIDFISFKAVRARFVKLTSPIQKKRSKWIMTMRPCSFVVFYVFGAISIWGLTRKSSLTQRLI